MDGWITPHIKRMDNDAANKRDKKANFYITSVHMAYTMRLFFQNFYQNYTSKNR